MAAGLAAAALWLEPISVTLGYRQINLLIAALVVFDLSRPDEARTKGVAIGVAAAIKLTPLLFIAYLLFSRRRRAAGVAGVAFIGSIALSFIVDTRNASAYWFHTILRPRGSATRAIRPTSHFTVRSPGSLVPRNWPAAGSC